jgi:hypothetical protein
VALIMLFGVSPMGGADQTECPHGSTAFSEAWTPLPWRDPLDLCRCPSMTYCRGPYCHHELDRTTNRTVWTAAIRGCGAACKCLPLCRDNLNCWDEKCVCPFTLSEQYLPRDPRTPHSPQMIADALNLALPPHLLDGGQYNEQYLNPCWRPGGADSPLRCMPFAYIPGILKCATSALYDTLEKHPQVCRCSTTFLCLADVMQRRISVLCHDAKDVLPLRYLFPFKVLVSYPKETHWWTRSRPPYAPAGRQLPSSQWLRNHAGRIQSAHRRGAPEMVVVEGSASLFWEQPVGSGLLTPELLHAVGPQTR